MSDDHYTVDYLKRKARSVRLEAARASPSLAAQLLALASLYEVQLERAAGARPAAS